MTDYQRYRAAYQEAMVAQVQLRFAFRHRHQTAMGGPEAVRAALTRYREALAAEQKERGR